MTETVILALITLVLVCVLLFGVYKITGLVLSSNPTKLSIATNFVRLDTEFKKSR